MQHVYLALFSIFSTAVFAIYRATLEGLNGPHGYAGCLRGLLVKENMIYSCSGSLVDIEGFPKRRTFLSAGHCATDNAQPVEVTFGSTCYDNATVYKVTKFYGEFKNGEKV